VQRPVETDHRKEREMKVRDLIELLENYDDDADVMVAHQPSYPLAETLAGVASNDDREAECPEHDGYLVGHAGCDLEPESDDETIVWLVAGGHHWDRSPYAPRWVFDAYEATR
jgi:hypothetical protein